MMDAGGFPSYLHLRHEAKQLQGGPPSYELVISPLTIDISAINHSYWNYNQLSYLGGTTLYGHVCFFVPCTYRRNTTMVVHAMQSEIKFLGFGFDP